jgi:hypothetical protein
MENEYNTLCAMSTVLRLQCKNECRRGDEHQLNPSYRSKSTATMHDSCRAAISDKMRAVPWRSVSTMEVSHGPAKMLSPNYPRYPYGTGDLAFAATGESGDANFHHSTPSSQAITVASRIVISRSWGGCTFARASQEET